MGTRAADIQVLNDGGILGLKYPAVLSSLAGIRATPMGGSAADFGRFLQSEIVHWGAAVQASGAQLD
jgi:hypothetical protein